jgi:uroporphyrinogen decarboxylase
VVWIPGFWVEYGMVAEPSAFGAKIRFHSDRPPSIEPLINDFDFWAEEIKPIDPHEDGIMPLVLRLYEVLDERLRADGLGVNMVAARGPMAVLAWLTGISPLMMEIAMNPDRVSKLLDVVTTSLIRWLQAQLDAIQGPEGILLLDDVVGMVSKKHYEAVIHPHLRRIFDAFDGLIRIYHNDTPCAHLLESLADANFDVFNFSHKIDIAEAKQKIGHRAALMGNVPPLEVAVRGTPEDVAQWGRDCLDKVAAQGGLILSVGGGVSPGTPPENIDALVDVVKQWKQK